MHFEKQKFELVAYRGGAGERPENTMAAFRHAIDSNPDVILDLDFQFTADGRVVVFHDESLERTTNGEGMIKDLTFRQVTELDAGYSFSQAESVFPFRGNSESKIVEFDEVISAFPSQRLLVDIRRYDPRFVERVVQTVSKHDAGNRCVIMSESNKTLRLAQRLGPRLSYAASAFEVRRLFFGLKMGIAGFLPSKSAYFMIPEEHNGMKILTDSFHRELLRRNKTVFVWTVDDSLDAERMQKLGVNGIFTNYPLRIQSKRPLG